MVLLSVFLGSAWGLNAQTMQKENKKQIAVWDTYVPRKDGRVMHFDILVPAELKDTATIFGYGRQYLRS